MSNASAESVRAVFEGVGFADDFIVLWAPAVSGSIAAGDLDQAQRQIAQLADVPPGRLLPLHRAQLLRMQGMLALHRGDDPEELLRAGIDALDQFGAVPDAARARHALGGWLAGQGRDTEATELLVAARATYTELEATGWLSELAELGLIARVA